MLAPTNPDDRPEQPLTGDAQSPRPPRFPDLGEPAAVVRTPRAAGLPARWTATAYHGGAVVAAVTGRDIVADLAVGPDADDALAPPPTTRPRPPSTRACAGWSTSTAPRKPGWPCGWCCPAPSTRQPWTCSWWSVSPRASRPPEPTEWPTCSTPTISRTAWRSSRRARPPTTAVPSAPATPVATAGASSPLRSSGPSPPPPAPPNWARRAAPATSAPRSGWPRRGSRRRSGASPAPARATRSWPRRMQTALWPATWGYYLSQFTTLDDAARSWIRDHARRHLRPAGALPALRCGRQPYGVLAVTSLAGWSATGDDAAPSARLASLLATLRDQVWRPATAGAARVGRSDDPGADVVDVLRGWAHQRRLPRAPCARSALPDAPAPLARPGPRRDRLLRRPAPAHVEPARPRRRARSGRSRPVRVRGRQLPARCGLGP